MYRFKSAKFAGRTVAEVMLRDAPRLYELAAWAADKPHLQNMVQDFNRLRQKLDDACVVVRCSAAGCGRRATGMTFEEATGGGYLPFATMWCSKHVPSDDFISQEVPIHFDAISMFETRGEKRIACRRIREALGIKKGARITEAFARCFFAKLS